MAAMNFFRVRRAARKASKEALISELERETGVNPYAMSGLPNITVVRDPTGDFVTGTRWKSQGFGCWDEVTGSFKWTCVRQAKRRLRAMMYTKLVKPTQVKL